MSPGLLRPQKGPDKVLPHHKGPVRARGCSQQSLPGTCGCPGLSVLPMQSLDHTMREPGPAALDTASGPLRVPLSSPPKSARPLLASLLENQWGSLPSAGFLQAYPGSRNSGHLWEGCSSYLSALSAPDCPWLQLAWLHCKEPWMSSPLGSWAEMEI